MASRGRREYLIQALDEEEATDRAIDEATRSNWRVRLMRGVKPTTTQVDRDWWKVTIHVTEIPH